MGKITLIIILFLFIGCEKHSNLTRENKDNKTGAFVKKDAFINAPGIYYLNDISIIVKEFKDDTIIYGIFDYYNKPLYQRNINNSISNHMKWTIYIDEKNNIWFYNSDYQETNVFIHDTPKGIFLDKANNLPVLPKKLLNFIKNK